MHRRLPVVLVALQLLALGSIPSGSVQAAVPSYTGLVLDPGSGPNTLGSGEVIDLDPGPLQGIAEPDRIAVHIGEWIIQFWTNGIPFETRTYDTSEVLSDGHHPVAMIFESVGCVANGRFTILELAIGDDAQPTPSVAVDFVLSCRSTGLESDLVRGSLRLNSSLPTHLVHAEESIAAADTFVGSTTVVPVTLEGVGGGPSPIDGVALAGAASGWSIADDPCSGTVLLEGESCIVSVAFAPPAAGDQASSVTVNLRDFGTRTIDLHGYGVSPLTTLPVTFDATIDEVEQWGGSQDVALRDPSTFGGTATTSRVTLDIERWHASFRTLDGRPLSVGRYATPDGAFGVAGDALGCGSATGWFDVLEPPLFDPQGRLIQFAADYEQRCSSSITPWRGAVRFHSTAALPDLIRPSGTVIINGGAAFTRSPDVDVTFHVADGSPISLVALSNSNSGWTTLPYAVPIRWRMYAGDGQQAVYAKFADAAGNWSRSSMVDVITLDTVGPTAQAPAFQTIANAGIWNGWVPIRMTWEGADDAGGGVRFELEQSVDGGPFVRVRSYLTSPVIDLWVAPWHTYWFRVRSVDRAGNMSEWAVAPASRIVPYQESSLAIDWSGSWSKAVSTGYWGGAARQSAEPGATVAFGFTGRSIAWVGAVGPSRGQATVYVDGLPVATIDLTAPAGLPRRILFSQAWDEASHHTIQVVVSGTGRVDIDGFILGT